MISSGFEPPFLNHISLAQINDDVHVVRIRAHTNLGVFVTLYMNETVFLCNFSCHAFFHTIRNPGFPFLTLWPFQLTCLYHFLLLDLILILSSAPNSGHLSHVIIGHLNCGQFKVRCNGSVIYTPEFEHLV